MDRKTVRRYAEAAAGAGVVANGDESQLDDGLIGVVCLAVRPERPRGHGAAWEALEPHVELVRGWVKDDLTLVKIHILLVRRGVDVPYRTLQRFAVARAGYGRRQSTVRVADGEPGMEVQVDFGKMGLVSDPATGRRRVTHALIFTACYSRHNFVFLSHHQTTEAVIEGFEAAWAFYGGVFKVVIPDNMSPIVSSDAGICPFPNRGGGWRPWCEDTSPTTPCPATAGPSAPSVARWAGCGCMRSGA
ncbi:MAG: IS21 family transposase, partial [Acidimicrobiales bacterium]